MTPNRKGSAWRCWCRAVGMTAQKPVKVKYQKSEKRQTKKLSGNFGREPASIPAWQRWTGLHFPWCPQKLLFAPLLRLNFWRSTSNFGEVFGIIAQTSLPWHLEKISVEDEITKSWRYCCLGDGKTGKGLREASADLSHNRVNLLDAQREDTGQERLEGLTRLLNHHLQDFQELLHHSTSCTALLQNAGCQLFPAADTSESLISLIMMKLHKTALTKSPNLVNMLRNVWMICPVKATPIWTLNAWKSVRKKANISSVASEREKWLSTEGRGRVLILWCGSGRCFPKENIQTSTCYALMRKADVWHTDLAAE